MRFSLLLVAAVAGFAAAAPTVGDGGPLVEARDPQRNGQQGYSPPKYYNKREPEPQRNGQQGYSPPKYYNKREPEPQRNGQQGYSPPKYYNKREPGVEADNSISHGKV
ncbi:hypothetical protein QBC47DRAFT_360328 [Echria macrotheca]|uniref:Uncharacterized protein n=1 Tax=Echria macrotheca TaxID=438768 RepID=A0AAJ0BCB0_9PEZI|nr:hypothetical protein QBC47DRAFT_360328 [Echria macrotheca]